MTTVRRSRTSSGDPATSDLPAVEGPDPAAVLARQGVWDDQSGVPIWAIVVGTVLVLVFVGVGMQAFSGRPTAARLAALVPGARTEALADTSGLRVLYETEPGVKIGQGGIGTRGEGRPYQAGDLVLFASGRLVRIEAGDTVTDLTAAEGAVLQVASLGPWDANNGRLAGLPARYTGGRWTVDASSMQSSSAPLHVKGAPEEELTDLFRLTPPNSGLRVRRVDQGGPIVRIRATVRVPSFAIDITDPLPSLDRVPVTLRAVVRASLGSSVYIGLTDTINSLGTIDSQANRQAIEREDQWITLRLQQRIRFPSAGDRFAVGLTDVRAGSWMEVREMSVYLGILP